MSLKEKIVHELRTVLLTTVYFLLWFGALMLIKVLLLREYQIEFFGLTKVIIGALVIAKVVLVLEYVHFPFTRNQPAWLEMLLRTLFYMAGVWLVLAIERAIELSGEYGSFTSTFGHLFEEANFYHVWVSVIVVSGALLFFNIWSVIKMHYGKNIFRKMMNEPLPNREFEN